MSSYWGQTPTFGTIPVKQFTGDGTANPIDMGFSPGSPYAVLFLIEGVPQLPDSYNINGNSITPGGSIPLGANCFVIGHGIGVAMGVPGSGTVTVSSFDPVLLAVLMRTDLSLSVGKGHGLSKGSLLDSSTVSIDLTQAQAFDVVFSSTVRTLAFPTAFPANASAGVWYVDCLNSNIGTALTLASGYKIARGSFDTSSSAINRLWLVVRSSSVIDVYIDNLPT